MNDDLLTLCQRIRQMDQELDVAVDQLRQLYGGPDPLPGEIVERLEVDDGINGIAWALVGNIETGSWSDMVEWAGKLEAVLAKS